MCGIAGVLLGIGGDRRQSGDGLRTMLDQLTARGPDEEGTYLESQILLGCRRLAIVGGERGKQPISSVDGTLTLVLNGEIYNHRELRNCLGHDNFRGTSDAEVVLLLYQKFGIEAFKNLNGMFACAIWDSKAQVLTLARDRLGIKPLFFHRNGRRLIFGSEIKTLLAYPDCDRVFDWSSALSDPWMSEDLVYSEETPKSFFVGIEVVRPGEVIRFSTIDLKARRNFYWRFPNQDLEMTTQTSRIVEMYREALISSCRDCFKADSTLGMLLSGGIDSGIIAALGAREGYTFESFTLLTQSTVGNGDALAAKELARLLGLDNHQVLVNWDDVEISPDLWASILWICENPSCGPEQLFKYLLLRYIKNYSPTLRITMSGQGSDEFNGGYSRELAVNGRHVWANTIGSLKTIQKFTYHRLLRDKFLAWEQEASLLRPKFLEGLIGRTKSLSDTWSMYQRSKLHDLELFNLWHEDRICSHFGFEGRVPFLDHRLIEICARVPSRLRRKLFWDKEILRLAATTFLPTEFARRRKVPFFYGPDLRFTQRMIAQLLKRDNYSLVERAFPVGSDARKIVDVAELRRAIFRLPSNLGATFQLMKLVNMGLLEQFAKNSAARPQHVKHPIVCRINTDSPDLLKIDVAQRRKDLDSCSILNLSSGHAVCEDIATKECHLVSQGIIQQTWGKEDTVWIRLLKTLNGRHSLGEILVRLSIKEGDVRKYLEEALDQGFLYVRSMAADHSDKVVVNQ